MTTADLVRTLGDLLTQPSIVSIEIVPGSGESWTVPTPEPYILVDGNLGVFQKSLYRLYPTALSLLRGESASQASSVILLVNPAHQTALNARKRLIKSEALSAEAELRFYEQLMPSSRPAAKESISWAHRRWLLQHISATIPPNRFDTEFKLIARCCELYPRNYYAWTHHSFLVQYLCSALSESHGPASSAYESVLVGQAHALRYWIETHVSDFSAMHHYCELLSCLQALPMQFAELSEPSAHLSHVLGLVALYPDHESLWVYLRAITNLFPDYLPSALSSVSAMEGEGKTRFVHCLPLRRTQPSCTPYMAKQRSRSTVWIVLGLLVFVALSGAQKQPASPPDAQAVAAVDAENNAVNAELDQAAEATRAYKQALNTLSTLTANPPLHTYGSSTYPTHASKSLFSAFFPNLQAQGPLASAMRILLKLQRQFAGGLLPAGERESRWKREETKGKAVKVIDLLQHSAELGNTDALYTLAQISLFPPTNHFPSDPKLAFDSFSAHASITGNASSQAYIAFFHATGYQKVVPTDQARAQLYYTFAANGGDKGAQMSLAYRYWSGIGTLEDCGRALDWYERAAEKAMEAFIAGPPGGRTLPQTPTRLSDLVGGVYGPGASVASTGLNAQKAAIRAGLSRASGETWEDILDYYLFNADRREIEFAYRLGKIFYQGSIYTSRGGIASGSEGVGAVPRDFERARHYFLLIARLVWSRDPPNPLQYTPTQIKDENLPIVYASSSAAYLGRMYLRGEGVKADPALAKMWFERGSVHGDRECQNGLGIIWRDGLLPGYKADIKKAITYFTAAANQELAEAQINLAKYHFVRGELPQAAQLFDTAVIYGSPFEAYYYLGQIHSVQYDTRVVPASMASGSCSMAVSFYKIVAERGVWGEDLLREAEISWMTDTERGREMAMLKWWIAAERGSEIAQNNLAHILDQDRSILRLTRFSPNEPSNDTARLALTQWTRAAAQRNIDALVKVGDYYYHGLGVADDEVGRFEKAVKYYQAAADTQQSALAMWNLGWMYENGIGVPQDFHLAKRHYDMALETNAEASFPVYLSLMKLYARSIWHTLTGGDGGLNLWQWDEDAELQSPPRAEMRSLDTASQDPSDDPVFEQERYHDEDDGPWYIGKAREDFRRKKAQTPGEDEDPIQWARDRRNAEQDRETEFGADDYQFRGDGEADDFSDTVLLMLLCLAVSVLIYVRTRIVDRMRREQQPQQGEGNNPAPAGLERDDWAVLR
ncbi:Ubiquitin-protein ligase [Mycena chlorophos]|uniref:Ubiquitin-protein ligase n=1 Tax=Mycena chlorophos TaxID=658473 RepID=A0A8H6SFQ4_MYCCL|nr:Ubiquitin-protein ligase [Mycena chlorophos]